MEPFRFQPIFKETVWGGEKLNKLFNYDLPSDKIGEIWSISCRTDDMSVVETDNYLGSKFNELIEKYQEKLLGTKVSKTETFPLLVKLIDANTDLSIQVHPDDNYANTKLNLPYGKTEMWYIIDAPDNAFLYIGLVPNITKKDFCSAIDNNTILDTINKLPVKKGDIINIPAGLIHAITTGIVIAEIQQNSDTTFRIFDYNRLGLDGLPRRLDLEQSLDVIDFEYKYPTTTISGITVNNDTYDSTYYICNKYFSIITYDIKSKLDDCSDEEKFYILTITSGSGQIFYDKDKSFAIKAGESIFIPATCGEYSIIGEMNIIKSFVPDMLKDFINPLENLGFSIEEIKENCGVDNY